MSRTTVRRSLRLLTVTSVLAAGLIAAPSTASADGVCVYVYRYPTGSPSSKTYVVNQCSPSLFDQHASVWNDQPVGGTTYGVRVEIPIP